MADIKKIEQYWIKDASARIWIEDISARIPSTPVTGNYVRYDINTQGLTNTQKSNARTNISAAASSHDHDGTYLKLSGGTMNGDIVACNINPAEDQSYQLGDSGQGWTKLYVKNIYIDELGSLGGGDIQTECTIAPASPNLYDLGTAGNYWRNVYVKSLQANSTIRTETNVSTGSHIEAGGNISADGTVSAKNHMEAPYFQETSDVNKKNIISDINLDKAYDLIDKCSTIIYTLKDDPTQREQIGAIAQEVQEFFPELVETTEDGSFTLSYSRLTVVIMKVMKDLIKRIEKLENK